MKTKILLFITTGLLGFYPLFSQNTVHGVGAGNAGDFNTSLGFNAGDVVTSIHGTFVGHMAGKNTTGHSNSFLGSNAGFNNTFGVMNCFFGVQAGFKNTTGQQNAFFGTESGYSNIKGMFNSFFGTKAGYANEGGTGNTMIGNQAGFANKDGHGNTFIGSYAGFNELGGSNAYFGHYAGMSAAGTSQNVYLGPFTGFNNSSGAGNTFVGYGAGWHSDGALNVFIGNTAGFSETGSNKLIIDNGAFGPASPLIYGNFWDRKVGIATTALGAFTFSVNGDAFATGLWVSSDKRFKQNEKIIEGALEKVKSINGFSYQFKQDESVGERIFSKGNQMGFLAQDLQKVFPDLVMDDGSGYLAVNYQGMIPVLVEAVKELSGQLQQQSIEIELLRQSLTDQTELSRSPLQGRLYQNVPNPSKGSETRIAYELSETTQSGLLYIFDLQGKSIASYPVSQKQGEVTIPSGKLAAGLYHYSLVVGGKIVDTKKMLVAE